MKFTFRTLTLAMMLGAFVGAQPSRDPGGLDPDIKVCQAMARGAKDALALRSRSGTDLNELDWKLGVCVGKFVPLSPTGVPLILSAHGNVADVLRMRLEKAIETLPVEEQTKV